MKNAKLNCSNPFDDSAIARQKRMGLLTSGGLPNMKAITTLAQVYATLFFDQLCDSSADMERCVQLCEDMCGMLQAGDTEKLLFSICLQYDEHLIPLPTPIWWCLNNHNIILPYVKEFTRYLSRLIKDLSLNDKE